MIGFPKWLLFGLCSASIGGAVWVALSYFLNVEVVYLALGIGFLAGVGVRFAAGDDHDGFLPGAAAVIAAVAVIAFSKYMVVSLAVNAFLGGVEMQRDVPDFAADRGAAIAWTADEIIETRHPDDLGAGLDWPPGMTYHDATRPEHYPPALLDEATEAWDGLSEEERARKIALWSEPVEIDLNAIKMQAFQAQFGLFDLLWFGLAAFTAFGLGSGTVGGDD